MILEQLGVFWANTEVVLELLTKKGQHVEHFIGFANKPRLMQRSVEFTHAYIHYMAWHCTSSYSSTFTPHVYIHRFLERMEEYKRFWENVSLMCRNYLMGMQNSASTQGGSVGPVDGAKVY